MRGWMNEGKSYIRPVEIGEVMRAGGVGRVIASRNPRFAVGDHVSGTLGVQEFCLSDGRGLTKVDPALAPLPVHLGVLGMTGMTAYFGLLDIGRPEPGQTVVVSGAAGAVGSVVGQIAKIKGCRVIGIAGGERKCHLVVEEFGFDACIDYKSEDVRKALREVAPGGVDVYFDNVGGDILDAVLTRLARGARIVICGAISQYNSTDQVKGPANYMSLLVNRASMTGRWSSTTPTGTPRPPPSSPSGCRPGNCGRWRTWWTAACKRSPTPCCGCSRATTPESSFSRWRTSEGQPLTPRPAADRPYRTPPRPTDTRRTARTRQEHRRDAAMELKDAAVVVTGAGSGIGAALARRFAAAGARLVVNDLDAAAAARVAEEICGTAVPGDASEEQDVAALIAAARTHLGEIDLFCANAGIEPGGGADAPEQVWERVWQVNVMSHVRAAQQLLGPWLEPGRGPLPGHGLLRRPPHPPSLCAVRGEQARCARLRRVARGHLRRPGHHRSGAVPTGGTHRDVRAQRPRREGPGRGGPHARGGRRHRR